FNDYSEEGDLCFCEVKLDKTSRFANRTIAKLGLPPGLAVALVLRNGKRHVPDGDFVLRPLDTLIVTGTKFDSAGKLLDQERIDEGDERIGQPLSSLEGDVQRLVCI
ncbi:TrkA C-terminal domain-containing protein, partial [uncultured Dubosiella sp.]